jgi:DNA topoisomerase IB
MPVAVKTKKQESLWNRAKSVVERMKARGHDVDDFWAMVMHVYGQLQGAKKSETDRSVRLVVGCPRKNRMAKSRGVPVGHVSVRKDGSRWKKVAPGRWEEVRERTGVAERLVSDDPLAAYRGVVTTMDKVPKEALKGLGLSKYPYKDIDPSNVRVDLTGDVDSHAVLVWRDKKGRQQSAYSDAFVQRNAAVKWSRVKSLAPLSEEATRTFRQRMNDGSLPTKKRDAAAVMYIISQTGLRPGSRQNLARQGTRGVTTLDVSSVTIDGPVVDFDFIGKAGKRNTATVEDQALAGYISERAGDRSEGLLFDAVQPHVRGEMDNAGLRGFKPKDFRTLLASKLAAEELGKTDPPPPLPESRKQRLGLISSVVKRVSDRVAKALNNTPAVARKAYINPAIFQSWMVEIGAVAKSLNGRGKKIWEAALKISLPGQGKRIIYSPWDKEDPPEELEQNRLFSRSIRKSRSFHPVILKPADRPSQTARSHEEPEHPYHGQVDVQGLVICIENRRGSVRRGPGWKTKMGHHYGEIRGTRGADGDALDAYVGPNHDSNLVVIVHQKEPGRASSYDEDKVMLGFDTVLEALKAYRDQYDKPGFYGAHTVMTMPEFQRWLDRHGKRGVRLSKAQLELLDLMKAGPLNGGLTIEIDLVKGGYDIGYVSTRKDGSQWRKVAQGKWEQVKLKGGVKAQPAKAEHYRGVADDMKGKAERARDPFRRAVYLGAEAASKALAEGKDDAGAEAAFDDAYMKAGGREELKNDKAIVGTVRRMHHRAVAKASQQSAGDETESSAETKPAEEPGTETKPEPAEAPDVAAPPQERAEHREEQRQSLEDAGLSPHQIETVQGDVPAPVPEKAAKTPADEPEPKKGSEVAEGAGDATEATGESAEAPVPGGPPPKEKPPEEEAEKAWGEMTDKEKKKAYEKLKAEHADLLLLQTAVKEMDGMGMDPRTRAYNRVLKFMKKAVKQSGGGKEPAGAKDAHDEAKKASGEATGQAKRFFDRLADRLARWVPKMRVETKKPDAGAKGKKAAKKADESGTQLDGESHRG